MVLCSPRALHALPFFIMRGGLCLPGWAVSTCPHADHLRPAVQAPALGPPAPTLFDATMELLDTPHPLDTLSEVGAYGPDGAISRFHNPDNYTRALGGVLRARVAGWGPLLAAPGGAGGGGSSPHSSSRDQQQQQRRWGLGGAGAKTDAGTGSPLGPAVAATGALWFLPYKGTQKVTFACPLEHSLS